jgi:hypothetical protein
MHIYHIHNVFAGILHDAMLIHLSCCKRRIMPTAYRFRMYQEIGSTCPHAHIRSSLISAKVRTVPALYALTFPLPSLLFHFIPILSSLVCGMTWGVLTLRRDVAHIGLEKVTQGLARATSHRVLAPATGTSPRYSIPFFQNLAQDVRLSEHVLQCTSRSFLRLSFRCTHFCFF